MGYLDIFNKTRKNIKLPPLLKLSQIKICFFLKKKRLKEISPLSKEIRLRREKQNYMWTYKNIYKKIKAIYLKQKKNTDLKREFTLLFIINYFPGNYTIKRYISKLRKNVFNG